MPTEKRLFKVFLCQRLLAEGWIDPWLVEENLLPSMDWDVEIKKAQIRFNFGE